MLVEHGVNLDKESKRSRRRPDMTTFFNKISEINTNDASRPRNNPHAIATLSVIAIGVFYLALL